ncbi:hypothetical protein ACOKFD_15760 [Flagellimonas sp. S174]|uniref:hypothetical protein n=1 Tax=Flagellimonas sp. S174 TaxID=3410790 RepID=UPI003BF47A5A
MMDNKHPLFGPEWKAEKMKMSKSDILDAFAIIATEKMELEQTLNSLGVNLNQSDI